MYLSIKSTQKIDKNELINFYLQNIEKFVMKLLQLINI